MKFLRACLALIVGAMLVGFVILAPKGIVGWFDKGDRK